MGIVEAMYAGEAQLNAANFIQNPLDLRALLELHGAFSFIPFRSGLFPASNISVELGQQTGMDMGWLRDNAHIGNALYEDGRLDLAVPVAVAMIKILDASMDIINDVVNGTNTTRRIPVRYVGDTLARDHENRVQNDSVGYALWFVTKVLKDGVIVPTQGIQHMVAQTARYLEAIEYWHDFDQGHWEEDDRIHTTSIGAVIAGLRGTQELFQKTGYKSGIDFDRLIASGYETIDQIHALGLTSISKFEATFFQNLQFPKVVDYQNPDAFHEFLEQFSVHRRRFDSAELFLIEPLGVITGDAAQKIYRDNEKYLERFIGTGRYEGDSYWKRNFPEEMTIEERTHSAPGRLEQRNRDAARIAFYKTEAQWTLFDATKSDIAGKWYISTHDPYYLNKHLNKLNRNLQQLVKTPNGDLHWTENFYLADRQVSNSDLWESTWLPNPHSPLLWTQANSLKMLLTFERVVPFAKALGHL